MPALAGQIYDAGTGAALAARVHVLDAGGRAVYPDGAIRKVGPGLPAFYADGAFEVTTPGGLTTILVERGTEYKPFTWQGQVAWGAALELPVPMERWTRLPERGWYPGNTHIHYDEHEADPDTRLRLDPQVHDLHVTVVSVLQRGDVAYAVNRYPVGFLNDFACAHHAVDCGEECRHNREPWTIGYGHVLFLRLSDPVLPISRGILVDDLDPDYPPLCYACDAAHNQGGIAIWCHNGAGMEAPVAAVLGKLDACNLFDPYQVMPEEYDIWYRLLNCGIRLPASTGSDWYVCSNNRVYVQLDGDFSYDVWLAGLALGRSFITNGAALWLSVNGAGPGDTLLLEPGATVDIEISWEAQSAIERVELIHNGLVTGEAFWPDGRREGVWRGTLVVSADGWLAARLAGSGRDSFWQPAFAHTSPVWLAAGRPAATQAAAARSFVLALDDAMAWVRTRGRFRDGGQTAAVLDLYRAGQAAYGRLAASASE